MLDRDGLPLDRPPGRVVARACCRAAYLRGAFLGGGSLSGPRSPHLELRTALARRRGVRPQRRVGRRRSHARDRPRLARGRLREELGRDRVAPRGRGRGGDRARARGARRRRRAARATRTGSRTPITRTSSGTSRAARAQLEAARTLLASGALEQLAADAPGMRPSSGSGTRRSRCGSSRRGPTRP